MVYSENITLFWLNVYIDVEHQPFLDDFVAFLMGCWAKSKDPIESISMLVAGPFIRMQPLTKVSMSTYLSWKKIGIEKSHIPRKSINISWS